MQVRVTLLWALLFCLTFPYGARAIPQLTCPVVGEAKENIVEVSCDENAGTYSVVTHIAPSKPNIPFQEQQKSFALRLNGQDLKERKLFHTCHLGNKRHVVTDIDLDRERRFLQTGLGLEDPASKNGSMSTLITSAADIYLFNGTEEIAEITDVMFYQMAVSIVDEQLTSCRMNPPSSTSYDIKTLPDKPLQMRLSIGGAS